MACIERKRKFSCQLTLLFLAKSLGKIVYEFWGEKVKLVRRRRHKQQKSFYHDLKMKEDSTRRRLERIHYKSQWEMPLNDGWSIVWENNKVSFIIYLFIHPEW